jgi:hypothetical protein
MATRAQLEQALRNAHAAGDTKAAQILARELKATARPAPAPKKAPSFWDIPNKLISGVNEAAIGVGEGLRNTASAITDPILEQAINFVQGGDRGTQARTAADRNRKAITDRVARTVVSNPDKASRDVGRFGGSTLAAAAIPLGRLQTGGRLARAGARAIQGAVGGLGMREAGEDPTTNAAIGAAANVVLPPVLKLGARAGSAIVGKVADKFNRGLAAPVAPALGAEAAERVANFADVGIEKPTTGMVTRNPTAWDFERRAATADQSLADQIKGIERSLITKTKELISSRGTGNAAEATGVQTRKVLQAKKDEMKAITDKLYTQVRDERGDEIVGDLPFLREKMNDPDVLDNAVFDSMRESLGRRMNTLGIFKDGKLNPKGRIDVSQAEELRKFIGKLGSSSDPAVRKLRSDLIDAIDEDVVEVIGDDAFKGARAAARARFTEFEKTYASKLLDETIDPEKLTKNLVGSASLDDIRSLRRSMLTGSPEQRRAGVAAWKQLRAQTMDDLLEGALSGEGNLAGRKLMKDFVAKSAKLKEVLGPKDYKKLEKLVVASRDATAAPEAGANAGVAQLFGSLPPKLQNAWANLFKTSGAHSAAFMLGGPAANVGLGAAQHATNNALQTRAANEFIKRIQMAQDPAKAEAAIIAARKAANSNPVLRELLEKGNIAGGVAVAYGDQ